MSTELGTSGQAIWSAYGADRLDAGGQALVRELARCADTLDRLDGLAIGRRETWVELIFDDMGEIHLVVDKILDQRRNHQLALKALFAEVRAAGIKAGDSGKGKDENEEPEDMLTRRRREKEERERKLG